jgi:hypothetical protein
MGWRGWAGAWLVALSVVPAAAHDLTVSRADVATDAEGTVRIDLSFDLHAWLLGLLPGHPSRASGLLALPQSELETRLAHARERFLQEVRLDAGGTLIAPLDVELPDPLTLVRETAALGEEVGAQSVIITARLPGGARPFTVVYPRAIGPVVQVDAVEGSTAWRYLVLGFEHILPKGLDHILFVLALFFLNPRLRPLLWQVTAFTLAHSITLSLSVWGIFSLPAAIVEPLIALSIAFVAVENLLTTKLHPWRPLVVFGFGLLHGLGFASVLLDLGLPRADFLTAVFAFNVGVEAGQLAVIGLAWLAVGWLSGRAWFRARLAVPASLMIALTGLYWTVERIMGTFS